MKKFTKLFLSCAAVAALTAAVATSAMAADGTLKADYATNADKPGTGTVTITCPDNKDETKTLLILKPAAKKGEGLNEDGYAVRQADILQIDQAADITKVTVEELSEAVAEDKGTYTVLMGGTSGKIYMGTFSIGGEPITIGDTDLSAGETPVDALDAAYVMSYAAGSTDGVGKVGAKYNSDLGAIVIGDTDLSGGETPVDALDAAYILSYAAGSTDGVGKVGTVTNASPAE